VRREQLPLLLREELPQRERPACLAGYVGRVRRALEGSGADEPPGKRVHLDTESTGQPQLLGQLARHDRAQLDDRVAALALDASRADDDAVGVEIEFGRVEEEDLADLRFERIELERLDGRPLVRLRDRQFQLDAVGSLEQVEQLHQVLVREARPRRRGSGHLFLLFPASSLAPRRRPGVVTSG